jgi:hypothetical protein
MGNLWDNSINQKQPILPVIPIVLYHGKKSWTPGTLVTRFTKWPEAVINYILQATEIEPDKLVKSVACISEKGGDIAMTTAEKLRQEGSHKTMVSLVRNAKKNGLSEEMIAQIANLDITLGKSRGQAWLIGLLRPYAISQ